MVPRSLAAITDRALGRPRAVRVVPSTGSTAMSTSGDPPSPSCSPLYSMGASSFSPSPITTTPLMATLLRKIRMASTAAPSAASLSPRPIHRAAGQGSRLGGPDELHAQVAIGAADRLVGSPSDTTRGPGRLRRAERAGVGAWAGAARRRGQRGGLPSRRDGGGTGPARPAPSSTGSGRRLRPAVWRRRWSWCSRVPPAGGWRRGRPDGVEVVHAPGEGDDTLADLAAAAAAGRRAGHPRVRRPGPGGSGSGGSGPRWSGPAGSSTGSRPDGRDRLA